MGQDELFQVLSENEPKTIKELANELKVQESTVSRCLRRLLYDGSITRHGKRGKEKYTFLKKAKGGSES